jgi:hypothetical protein
MPGLISPFVSTLIADMTSRAYPTTGFESSQCHYPRTWRLGTSSWLHRELRSSYFIPSQCLDSSVPFDGGLEAPRQLTRRDRVNLVDRII